jgi:hypothetical protein
MQKRKQQPSAQTESLPVKKHSVLPRKKNNEKHELVKKVQLWKHLVEKHHPELPNGMFFKNKCIVILFPQTREVKRSIHCQTCTPTSLDDVCEECRFLNTCSHSCLETCLSVLAGGNFQFRGWIQGDSGTCCECMDMN